MGRTEPVLGRFLSKSMLAIVPGVIASAAAVFVLYAVHEARTPEPAERLTATAPMSDGLSAEERRELTRQMLKARRENPEVPAVVRPTPTLRPSTTGMADETATITEPKARSERALAPLPVARPLVARTRPEQTPPVVSPVTTTASVPPPAAPAAPPGAVATGEPNQLPPVVVNTNPAPGVQPEPERRGFAANVFSSISVFAGTAANATGNTVNWVIELPGKAISAGGKLLGGDSGSGSNPPPPAAPPPKRNYL